MTGACTCGPGWRGARCELPCPANTYGLGCRDTCKCKNSVSCDTVSGQCTCESGWRGALCEVPCLPGTHGSNCTSECRCQNSRKGCHPVTGQCQCDPGWEVGVSRLFLHF